MKIVRASSVHCVATESRVYDKSPGGGFHHLDLFYKNSNGHKISLNLEQV